MRLVAIGASHAAGHHLRLQEGAEDEHFLALLAVEIVKRRGQKREIVVIAHRRAGRGAHLARRLRGARGMARRRPAPFPAGPAPLHRQAAVRLQALPCARPRHGRRKGRGTIHTIQSVRTSGCCRRGSGNRSLYQSRSGGTRRSVPASSCSCRSSAGRSRHPHRFADKDGTIVSRPYPMQYPAPGGGRRPFRRDIAEAGLRQPCSAPCSVEACRLDRPSRRNSRRLRW